MKRIVIFRFTSLLIMTLLVGNSYFVSYAASASSTVQASTLTFNAVADAFVSQASPNTNYGTNTALHADNSPVIRSYLRFTINGLNGAAVQSAKLRIYTASANNAGYAVRRLADNSWVESKITYNNSPEVGTIINSSKAFTSDVWTEVDVSGYVKAEGTYNLVLTTSSATNIKLAARERTGKSPQLVISAITPVTSIPTQMATSTTVPTQTSTATPLPTFTPTQTLTLPTTTMTSTLVPTATFTPTQTLPSPTTTMTLTLVPTATFTPTQTLPSPTATMTSTQVATATFTPTQTPNLPTATNTPTATPNGSDWQPSFPIRAAFYYPWFPEAWTQLGIYPYTNYTPALGSYSSTEMSTIQQHIAMMQYGNIQAGISSWWGQGQQTDAKFPGLLAAASGTNFRWALYYENESTGDPTVSQIQNDLTYIGSKYGSDPSFLRVNGKFVVFVYADGNDACGMADRWKQANTVGAYIVLKVFGGYTGCASQPDGWHQYSPAVAADHQGNFSYSISPGFWLKGQNVRLARDLTRWVQNVKDMTASNAKWQLVTTFSEWGEGTIVEPAAEWPSPSGYGQYLDALHYNGVMP